MNSFMNKMTEQFGITDFSNLSFSDYSGIMRLIGEENISTQDLSEFIQLVPHILSLNKTFLEHLNGMIDGLQKSHEKNFEHLHSSITILNQIMLNLTENSQYASADQMTSVTEMLVKVNIQYYKTVEEMNKDNNRTFLGFVQLATFATLGLVSIFMKYRKG